METYNFDNIRSFNDSEVKPTLQKLIKDPEFIYLLNKIYTPIEISKINEDIKTINSIEIFQKEYALKYAEKIISRSVNSITSSGIENLDPNKSYLFMSNHRDIILDSAFLNEILYKNGFKTTEIAIGSNLLVFPWIKDLVRLNRSFIVRRDLAGKEMLTGSQKLSAYIRKKIINDNRSVWIAQKEGRTKDGNDKTQVGLLKMFNFSGSGNLSDDFKELNIIPVSISYEYEPCDSAKAEEIHLTNVNGKYIKAPGQDMMSMARGLEDKKGKVHFSFGKIDDNIFDELNNIPRLNDKFTKLANTIDKAIYSGFKLHKNNYIAFDLINSANPKFEGKYTKAEQEEFVNFTKNQISSLEGDKVALTDIFYKIYSNPVKNKFQY